MLNIVFCSIIKHNHNKKPHCFHCYNFSFPFNERFYSNFDYLKVLIIYQYITQRRTVTKESHYLLTLYLSILFPYKIFVNCFHTNQD